MKTVVIKNLAQLRRELQPGRMFEVLAHQMRPDFTGQLRVVKQCQTNGLYSGLAHDLTHDISLANHGKGIWLAFNRAKDWQFEEGRCTCYDPYTHAPCMTFRVVDSATVE